MYLEPFQISKMVLFVKVANSFQPLTLSVKKMYLRFLTRFWVPTVLDLHFLVILEGNGLIGEFCEFFSIPAGNYMFKVNNRNTRTRCEICSKLTIKTPELWTYFTPCSSVSIVNFVKAAWDLAFLLQAPAVPRIAGGSRDKDCCCV